MLFTKELKSLFCSYVSSQVDVKFHGAYSVFNAIDLDVVNLHTMATDMSLSSQWDLC